MNLLDELTRTNADPAVIAQVRALIESDAKATRLKAIVAEKDFKIAALTHELAYYKRIQFGKKSEVQSGEQRELFDETVAADLAAMEDELQGLQGKKPKAPRQRAGRQALPPELPRIEHRHEPASCQCGQCGTDLVKIGEDVSEQLDVEPARFFVHRHIRPQYACRACETVTAAPVPPAVIDGGLAAPGLLAWVAVSKYADHLPLYRLEQIAARQGVTLARSTLAEWVGKTGVALQPLADRMGGRCWDTTTRFCMPMKHRCVNSIPAAARPCAPTCGPTAPTGSTRGRPSSCSTIRAGAPVPTHAPSWGTGAVSLWLTTMPATKPCSPKA
jgi:transposase